MRRENAKRLRFNACNDGLLVMLPVCMAELEVQHG